MLSAHAFLPGPSPAASVPESAPTDVADRSQTFQPVEGGTDHRNGDTLLVTAYAGLWALLMFWVVVQWTKQTALGRRLDDLEGAIARAGAAEAKAESKPHRGE
jgi:hypothetical protein